MSIFIVVADARYVCVILKILLHISRNRYRILCVLVSYISA